MGQLSYIQPWDRQWFTGGTWYLNRLLGGIDRPLAQFRGGRPGYLGFWPDARISIPHGGSTRIKPYFEGAIGAHIIEHTHVNKRRDMGSAFQFGDHLGTGILFGDRGQFDLGYRFQHVSNADIKRPNNGINFQQIRFAWEF